MALLPTHLSPREGGEVAVHGLLLQSPQLLQTGALHALALLHKREDVEEREKVVIIIYR